MVNVPYSLYFRLSSKLYKLTKSEQKVSTCLTIVVNLLKLKENISKKRCAKKDAEKAWMLTVVVDQG